jgi:hypothetical protein
MIMDDHKLDNFIRNKLGLQTKVNRKQEYGRIVNFHKMGVPKMRVKWSTYFIAYIFMSAVLFFYFFYFLIAKLKSIK